MAPQDTDDDTRARRRLKGFALHLMAYFIVVTVCAVLNHLKTPDQLCSSIPWSSGGRRWRCTWPGSWGCLRAWAGGTRRLKPRTGPERPILL